MMPLLVMACSSLERGDWLRSSARSVLTRMMGRVLLLPPLRDEVERRALRPFLPLRPPRWRWLPPRPNLPPTPLPMMGGEEEDGLVSQPRGFWSWPVSMSSSAPRVVATTVRENQPPRARERKMGRRAGAEAVMRARLVSMAEVMKPMLEAELVKMLMLKRPWTRRTRRMTDVMVTLRAVSLIKGEHGVAVTYKKPRRNTKDRASLVRFGMLRFAKIHNGNPRISKSNTMLKTAVDV